MSFHDFHQEEDKHSTFSTIEASSIPLAQQSLLPGLSYVVLKRLKKLLKHSPLHDSTENQHHHSCPPSCAEDNITLADVNEPFLAAMDTGEEIRALREVVHSLCQAVNPLGKAIDFLKEDTETMIKEQQFWIKDEKLHQNQLEEERRITEEMLQEEAGQLTELEEEINYQQRRIFSLKGEILQNDETIMRFLRMLTTPNMDLTFELSDASSASH